MRRATPDHNREELRVIQNLIQIGDPVEYRGIVIAPALSEARLWPKLRAGYLLDALERLDGEPTSFAALPTFLGWIGAAEASRRASVGLGEDVRLRGQHVVGSGLELEGELISLSEEETHSRVRGGRGLRYRQSSSRGGDPTHSHKLFARTPSPLQL
jgi:hypothetical protein